MREGLWDYLAVCPQQWLPMDHSVAECWRPHPCNHLSPVKSREDPPLNLTVTALRPAGRNEKSGHLTLRQQPVSGGTMWQIQAQSQTNVPPMSKMLILKLNIHARVINIYPYQTLTCLFKFFWLIKWIIAAIIVNLNKTRIINVLWSSSLYLEFNKS